MKENNKLDDKIKSSFESLNKKAPDMLWNQLSDSLHADSTDTSRSQPENDYLYNKIRDSFSLLREKAPQHVWQSINRQLNIDLVWSRLNKELDHSPSVGLPASRWAAVFLLFLLSFAGGYYLYREQPHRLSLDVTESISGKSTQTEQGVVNEAFSETYQSIKQPTGEPAIPDKQEHKEVSVASRQEGKFTASSLTPAGEGQQISPPSSGISYQKDEESIQADTRRSTYNFGTGESTAVATVAAVPNRNAASEGKTSTSPASDFSEVQTTKRARDSSFTGAEGLFLTSIPYQVQGIAVRVFVTAKDAFSIQRVVLDSLAVVRFAETDEDKRIKLNNFSLGPAVAYNNSWLLNNETRSSFDKGSLISTSPTFKQNLGLALYYTFDHKSTVATEFHFISKAGQEYNTFSDGYYQKMGLELNYYKLYLQYQRNFFPHRQNLLSDLTAKAGFYSGFLYRKNGEIRSTESTYSRFDYGLRFALGQEKRLNRLIIGYGISGERGLMNIFMGSDKMPARFNKTYTLSFGPYLNFRYNFKGRTKTR